MKHIMITLAALASLTAPHLTYAADSETVQQAEQAKAFFVNLKDGDTVKNPVHIVFGISGMEVAPAGMHEPNTGHFHLLIDTQLTDEQKQYPIPKDDQHLHFGKGQTEDTLTLSPGKHALQLVMGDGDHMLHNPPVMSDVINITVEE